MPVNGTLVFDISATVANGTHGTILNTLNATTTTGTRQEVVAVATGNAYANNLSVTGTPPLGPVRGGNTEAFVLDVRNDGPGSAFNVALNLSYGAGLSAASPITCTASGGAVCPGSLAPSMVAPEIPMGGMLSFSVPATVAAGTDALVSVTMQSAAAGDAFPGDNTDAASVRAVP